MTFFSMTFFFHDKIFFDRNNIFSYIVATLLYIIILPPFHRALDLDATSRIYVPYEYEKNSQAIKTELKVEDRYRSLL